MASRRTVRVVKIAELVGVSHQCASKIAAAPGFPAPVGRERQSRLWDYVVERIGVAFAVDEGHIVRVDDRQYRSAAATAPTVATRAALEV